MLNDIHCIRTKVLKLLTIYNLCSLYSAMQMENHAHATLSSSPFKGLVMASERPPMWNAVYPNFIPNEVNCFIMFLNFIIWNQLHIRLSTWILHIEINLICWTLSLGQIKDLFIGRECQIGKDYSTDGVIYNLWFWVARVRPWGDQALFFGD